MMTRLAVWHRNASTGARLYRRTPSALRRPEPWLRVGAVLFVLWFGGMFLALGVLGRRAESATPAASIPPAAFHAYFLAAALGVLGLGLLLTRRYRPGLGVVAGMLAVGQAATFAAVV